MDDVKKHYPSKNLPKWVNKELFYAEKLKELEEALEEFKTQEIEDPSDANSLTFYLDRKFLIPLQSAQLDLRRDCVSDIIDETVIMFAKPTAKKVAKAKKPSKSTAKKAAKAKKPSKSTAESVYSFIKKEMKDEESEFTLLWKDIIILKNKKVSISPDGYMEWIYQNDNEKDHEKHFQEFKKTVGKYTGGKSLADSLKKTMKESFQKYKEEYPSSKKSEDYEKMTVAELKYLIDDRNESRLPSENRYLKKTGKKTDLIRRLQNDDKK